MATSTWAAKVAHANDADFRVWGKKICDELALMTEIGVDETDIDWATITRPAVNTNAGYAVFHLADTKHATAPIYFRIDFGTSQSTATRMRIQLTVGTATDGAGVLSGTVVGNGSEPVTTAVTASAVFAPTNTTDNHTSYLCVDEGFIGYVGFAGAVVVGGADFCTHFFTICRTCDQDAAAAVNITGCFIATHQGQSSALQVVTQNLRFATPSRGFVRSTAATNCLIPHAEAASLIGADNQLYVVCGATPQALPMRAFACYRMTEATIYNDFTVAMVGTTTVTLRAFGLNPGIFHSHQTAASWGFMMLWQ